MNRQSIEVAKANRVEGEGPPENFYFSRDLPTHLAGLRQEFVGQPELCYLQAELIVRIRRTIDLHRDVGEFQAIWDAEHTFLASHLNSRWLVSALDTFVDYGVGLRASGALALVALINTVKLAETERLVLRDATVDPTRFDKLRETLKVGHVPLWDGMTAYSLTKGDMPMNLFARMERVLAQDSVLAAIGKALLERALADDTLLGRLSRMNYRFLGEPGG